jgi:hypothetical protein
MAMGSLSAPLDVQTLYASAFLSPAEALGFAHLQAGMCLAAAMWGWTHLWDERGPKVKLRLIDTVGGWCPRAFLASVYSLKAR